MKNSFITLIMLLGIFSFTSCTKDIPTPTNNLITAKTEVVVIIPANTNENSCNKDDNIESVLGIKVIDDENTPIPSILVHLEGDEIYSFETNPEGEDEKIIETGSYTLLVEDENTPLIILETTYNEGVLTIQIQE